MDYRELIKNWHNKAKDEDYFSKFVFEYLAFIAFLKTQKYSSNDTDRAAIQKLKQDDTIRKQYIKKIKFSDELTKHWKVIIVELKKIRLGDSSRDLNSVEEIKWWNCSHKECNQKTQQENQKLTGIIYSLSDWENMVEFWYSVRNNLFHGAKNPENERDQFAVKYGFSTLKELMEILLNE